MASPERPVKESPVGFEYAVAYALHPEMRRLIILYVVGTVMIPVGISWLLEPPLLPIIGNVAGILVAVIGAVFLFGGLVGALFKLVTDANILAASSRENL